MEGGMKAVVENLEVSMLWGGANSCCCWPGPLMLMLLGLTGLLPPSTPMKILLLVLMKEDS